MILKRPLKLSTLLPGRCGLCGEEGIFVEVLRPGGSIVICVDCALDVLNAYGEEFRRKAEAGKKREAT